MLVQVPTEVIPVWFIKEWVKDNAEYGSALDTFIKTMLHDWELEEHRHNVVWSADGSVKVRV